MSTHAAIATVLGLTAALVVGVLAVAFAGWTLYRHQLRAERRRGYVDALSFSRIDRFLLELGESGVAALHDYDRALHAQVLPGPLFLVRERVGGDLGVPRAYRSELALRAAVFRWVAHAPMAGDAELLERQW